MNQNSNIQRRGVIWTAVAGITALFWVVFTVAMWPRDRDTDAKLDKFSIEFESREYSLQAAAFHRSGNYAQAIPLYEKSLELVPFNELTVAYLGLAKRQSGDIQGALAAYDDGYNMDVNPVWFATAKAVALYHAGDVDGAYEQLDIAQELDETFPWIYQNRALIHLYEGEKERAINELRDLTKNIPDYAHAYDSLGVLAYEEGNPKTALEMFSKAIEADKNYAHAYKNRAAILMAQGDTAGSEKDMNTYKILTNIDMN